MKLLRCLLCKSECDIIGNEHAFFKHVKCQNCGYCSDKPEKKEPEIVIIRKRSYQD